MHTCNLKQTFKAPLMPNINATKIYLSQYFFNPKMTLIKIELISKNHLGNLPGYVTSSDVKYDAGVVVIQEVKKDLLSLYKIS